MGTAGATTAAITWMVSPPENATGNCPCATKWQIRQLSAESRRDWVGSSGRSDRDDDPMPCVDPESACRQGPHNVTAAWHAITEANKICRAIRDIGISSTSGKTALDQSDHERPRSSIPHFLLMNDHGFSNDPLDGADIISQARPRAHVRSRRSQDRS